ncbi:MAG TPA: sigma-70 family RNA polymerase sigma factor [Gaiellaceae bacterium]|nr:sigma-70 family RNA polymerase sigma factor [Gaiellaceae bacterium]
MTVNSSPDDGDLWTRARAGGRDAFAELFDRHANTIYSYCFRRTAEWSLAEDLTSVVFLEAWRKRHAVELAEDKVLPWLFGIATNVVRSHRRARRRYEGALKRLPPPERQLDVAEELVQRIDDERQMRDILEVLERVLPRLEQEAFALCAWQGLSSHEASLALGVPEATVRTRLFRARARLRDLTQSASGGVDGVSVRKDAHES